MVEYNKIKQIIGYTVKCWSRAKISERLSKYSREEKTKLLEGRLTSLEWMKYNEYVSDTEKAIDEWYNHLKEGRIDKDKIPMLYEAIEEEYEYLDEYLFDFDRRIIENYILPSDLTVPNVKYTDFKKDNDDFDEDRMFDDDSTIQVGESEQIKYQQENIKPTKTETSRMNNYFFNTYGYVNTRLWHGKTYAEEYYGDGIYERDELDYYNKEFPRILRSLDNLMNKSPGLQTNTRLYHGGQIDISLAPGMHGTFKGYMSTSFQEETAQRLANEKKQGDDWVIEILAPAGTKGICANDHENFNNNGYTFEHEYTLPRNIGYTVLEIDPVNKRQVVLLD